MSLSKFESMLKTNDVYFFDATEFEDIIQHYLNTGKHSLAKKAIQLGLEQHPASINLKLLSVEVFVFEGAIDKATRLLGEIEAVEPNNEEVFIQKATISSKNRNHKEAITLLHRSLEFSDDPIDIWAMIGMEYMYLDEYDSARLNFMKCIAVDYEDYSSLYNIIYCFEMSENHIEAVEFLKTYIDRNPYSEVAWHQLGRQYFELNRLEEALQSFDYAVLADENFIGGYLEKAKTLERLDRFEEAIENYIITLELDDPTAYAYIRIGSCYEAIENYGTAISYYKKAVYEDPLLDRGWVLLTEAYFNDKNYHKAAYYINKAIQIDDSNALYWRKYADINLKLNFFEEAVKAFYKCIDLGDTEIEIYLGLADVLVFIGDFEDALSIVVKARKIHVGFAEIEYRLCGLFFILDQKDFALLHLKNGLAIDKDFYIDMVSLFPGVFANETVTTIIHDFHQIRS